MKPPRPSQSFKVRPLSRGTLYLEVHIFKTKRDMYSWYRHFSRFEKRLGCNFEAIVLARHRIDCRGARPRSIPLVATMLFVRSRMTMEIVSHESGHAALAWFRRKHRYGKSPNLNIDLEEAFCYALGDIAREIVYRTNECEPA